MDEVDYNLCTIVESIHFSDCRVALGLLPGSTPPISKQSTSLASQRLQRKLRGGAKSKSYNSSSSSSRDAVHLLLQRAQSAHGLRAVCITSMIKMRRSCHPLWFVVPLVHGQRQLIWGKPQHSRRCHPQTALPLSTAGTAALVPMSQFHTQTKMGVAGIAAQLLEEPSRACPYSPFPAGRLQPLAFPATLVQISLQAPGGLPLSTPLPCKP